MKTMFLKLRTVFLGTLAVLLMMVFLTPAARATATTDFYLSGVGSGQVLAGVYTSPYSGSVSGPSGPIMPVICDDFVDESFIPEDWTAYVTPLSSFPATTSNPPLFNGASAHWSSLTTQAQAYTVAAILAIEILQNTGITQQEYSYALWELFDYDGVVNQLTVAYNYPSVLADATTDVGNAITAASGLTPASFPNVTIYSYDSGATCPTETNGICTKLPPQEFIVVTPEPTSTLLFGTGLLGIIFVMRKRLFA